MAQRARHMKGQTGTLSPMPLPKGTSAPQLSSLVEGTADLSEKSEVQAFMGNLLIKC